MSRLKCLSLVPRFGRFALDEFNAACWRKFEKKLRHVMRKRGVKFFLGGIDLSLNKHVNDARPPFVQLHAWGIILDIESVNLPGLKAEMKLDFGGIAASSDEMIDDDETDGELEEGREVPGEGRLKRREKPVWVGKFDGRENAFAYAVKPNFSEKTPEYVWPNVESARGPYRRYKDRPMTVGNWLKIVPTLHEVGLQSRVFLIGLKRGPTRDGWDFHSISKSRLGTQSRPKARACSPTTIPSCRMTTRSA